MPHCHQHLVKRLIIQKNKNKNKRSVAGIHATCYSSDFMTGVPSQ